MTGRMIDDASFFFNSVVDFNMAAGKKDCPVYSKEWWEEIQLQTSLIEEEGKEVKEAADNKDEVEVLKEAIDVLVVSFRLIDMLEKAGYDVSSAFDAVNQDNNSKVFDCYYKAIEELVLLEKRDNVEYYIETAFVDGVEKFTIRREDGKIMKTVGHKKVDLRGMVPVNIGGS